MSGSEAKSVEAQRQQKQSGSPFRIRPRTKYRTQPADDGDFLKEELDRIDRLRDDQIVLEVAGGQMFRMSSEATKPASRKHTADKPLKKLSFYKTKYREKAESPSCSFPRPEESESKDYQENMQLIKELLARCNMKYIEDHQLDSTAFGKAELVHTYGLKIQSMRYNISMRPKANSTQTQPRAARQSHSMKPAVFSQKSGKQSKLEAVTQEKLSVGQELPPRLINSHSKYKLMKECSQSVEIAEASNEAVSLRLRKCREFLFVINLSNRVYRTLEFEEYPRPLKYWIGRGNNSALIRSTLKKRFWFVETYNLEESNFVWTQIKVEQMFELQTAGGEGHARLMAPDVSPRKTTSKVFEPASEGNNTLSSLLSDDDMNSYKKHLNAIKSARTEPTFDTRRQMLGVPMAMQESRRIQHNHFPNNGVLGNKKALFYILKEYCQLQNLNLFSIVPLTFHVQKGAKDPSYHQFLQAFQQKKLKKGSSVWIVKPGEYTNRGSGITCCNNLSAIRKILASGRENKETARTYILQEYITNPLLYNGRKFDIRVYMMLSNNNGILKGYWYRQGYVRTASCQFDLKHLTDPIVHLTNDAIQKFGENYGKYEDGNKLSFGDLHRYIRSITKRDFYTNVLPQMKNIALQCIEAAYTLLSKDNRINNFQLFGLDFMIDSHLHPWLLQINTNPCLQLGCGILERLIPTMLENAFRIAVDPQFPPPSNVPWCQRHNISQNPTAFNKFELIFDEIRDGDRLKHLYRDSKVADLIGDTSQDKNQYQEMAVSTEPQ